jgi:hypothetical protein
MLKVVVDKSALAGRALRHLVRLGLFPLGGTGARAAVISCPERATFVHRFE